MMISPTYSWLVTAITWMCGALSAALGEHIWDGVFFRHLSPMLIFVVAWRITHWILTKTLPKESEGK